MLAIAAGIEQRSQHPIARAIVHHAESRQLSLTAGQDVQSLTGAGATGSLDGSAVYVGSPALFSSLGVSPGDLAEPIHHLEADGKTVVLIGDKQSPWGLIALRDELRPNARAALAALRGAGVQRIVMLTGDNERAANAIASALNIDEVHAGLSPEEKVRQVRALAQDSGHIAMVGDGVNDAPALAEATVGVAMGAAGTDVALETADVALMADDLEKLAYALHLARRTRTVVRQNLMLSVIVIGALVVGAVGGFFSLPVAVLGHEISEFVVIGSGLRMLRA
jgi:Cd2+/Zn2+-exporting ATPase